MWAATLSAHTQGRVQPVDFEKGQVWPADRIAYLNFLLLPTCLRWCQASDIVCKHFFRVSQSKTRQTPLLRRSLKASVSFKRSACRMLCVFELLSQAFVLHTGTSVTFCVYECKNAFLENCKSAIVCGLSGRALMPSDMVGRHVWDRNKLHNISPKVLNNMLCVMAQDSHGWSVLKTTMSEEKTVYSCSKPPRS